ncbi:MAG: S-layer homology domain-containing protein [Clostridia bacterium]|nr:S-layer homology domain-containing protein [Clostridia bacterium]
MKKLKKILSAVIVLALFVSGITMISTGDSIKWYTESVEWCKSGGYMVGMSPDDFGPHVSLTRAMFVTILAQIDGADLSEYEDQSSFADVAVGKWYAPAVEWAFQNGYVSGIDNGTEPSFGCDMNVTREQAAVIFYAYHTAKEEVTYGNGLWKYEDSSEIHSWAREAMNWAVGIGLLSGVSERSIAPEAQLTRAQMAVLTMKYVQDVMSDPVEDVEPEPIPDFSDIEREDVECKQLNNVELPEAYHLGRDYNFEFVSDVIRFAGKTSAEIENDGGNYVYSPVSLYYALSMLATGATGQGQRELYEVLGVDNKKTLSAQAEGFYRSLYADNSMSKLKLANSVWIDGGISPLVNSEWSDNIGKSFFAPVYTADLRSPEIGKMMSDWVKENTNGLLDYSFDPNSEKVMSIINALYFYDEWDWEFYERFNVKQSFRSADGSLTEQEFMCKTTEDYFYTDDVCSIAYLGLKNNGKVYFILPTDETADPADIICREDVFEKIFDSSNTDGRYKGDVKWKIPKFNYESTLDLAPVLKNLGVNSVFNTANALSGISDYPLYVGGVVQKSCIGIDEEGIEGASYTEVLVAGSAVPDPYEKKVLEMTLDRPFAYIVVAEGVPIFMGVINELE